MSTSDAPSSSAIVSRRGLLGAASATASVAAFSAARAASVSPRGPDSSAAAGGLKYRALMRTSDRIFIDDVTMDPLGPNRVLVRTEACQCCYSLVGPALTKGNLAGYNSTPRIIGHGGIGRVIAVGAGVRRVVPGDRVVVPNTPQCGECYNCIRGRADVCKMRGFASDFLPIGKLRDGTPVVQTNNEGGFSEYMIPYEEYCVPVNTKIDAAELSMIGCVGGCGLGLSLVQAPVQAGSNVVVFGCGPVGLTAIQGAKIMGAEQIIAVEPVPERLALAGKLGATVLLDPRAEGDGLVDKIKQLTKGWTDRKYAGARWTRDVNADNNQLGADYVFECVGGDRMPQSKPSLSPDPNGITPLKQAWEVTSEGGFLVTPSVSQRGDISFPATRWTNSNRTHLSSQFGGVHVMRDMPRFASLIEQGRVDVKSLVTMRAPLDQFEAAFWEVSNRTTIGAVVTFP